MKATAKRVPYFNTTATVDVDIDPDDLHEGGWHHENECAGTSTMAAAPLVVGAVSYGDAIASLHRQAHPGQLAACHEEPCRSLSFEQLRPP
jgi:hypothetical protein